MCSLIKSDCSYCDRTLIKSILFKFCTQAVQKMLSCEKCPGFVSPGCSGWRLISNSVNFHSLVCLPRVMEREMLAWSKDIRFKQTPVQQRLRSSLQRNQQHLQLSVYWASVLEIMKRTPHSLVSTCTRRLRAIAAVSLGACILC